jgi:hypothetical protein
MPGGGVQLHPPPVADAALTPKGALEVELGQEVPHTWLDVLTHNGDMTVPVRPRVLMPEANDMT